MRKLILLLAAGVAVAVGAFSAPANAAPIATQHAVIDAAGQLAPTEQARWRSHRRAYAPRAHVRRHVYRPMRYFAAPRHRRLAPRRYRYYSAAPYYYYEAPGYYPAPIYNTPVYVPPVVVPYFGYGGGYRGGYGGWGGHGGFGHRR